MRTQVAPILKLDDIDSLSKRKGPLTLCHTYGLFREKGIVAKNEYWHLCDDTSIDVKIKLCGRLDEYPKPIPGDIVRIHRLSFDRISWAPIILDGKNVVVWRGYKEDPTPITKAHEPTLTEFDVKRRKELEIYNESTITPINIITTRPKTNLTVAGQIEEITYDKYGNRLLKFCDGTGSFILRVFPKRISIEDNSHELVAEQLNVGDLMIATSVTLDKSTTDLVNLSANLNNGRSLSKIDPNNYLGRKLTLAIEVSDKAEKTTTSDSSRENNLEKGSKRPPGNSPVRPPLRRSPRLNATINPDPATSIKDNNNVQVPKYTRACDILNPGLNYGFFDLAGQVRGTPHETQKYNNYVLQLYDGSKPQCDSFYEEEIKNREPDCLIILVFSKQKPEDVDDHIKSVKRLRPGDLVLIKNVKATKKDGKLKLEMSANLAHGKSITVIEKTTKFGEILEDIVSNPITPDDSYHDATMNTSQESCITSESEPHD